MNMIARAFELAETAHAGQTDASDRDYFTFHVTPIAMAVRGFGAGPSAVAAALLHDVVEDTDITLEALRVHGFDDDVVDAVDSVSLRPGESYLAMIVRARSHPVGRIVKLADNSWNIASQATLPAAKRRWGERRCESHYFPARAMLLAGSGYTGAQIADLDRMVRFCIASVANRDETPAVARMV